MHFNPTLAESNIKSVVVAERYYRDSSQWDKLRGTYHPDPSKTSINITWYNGDIDGFVSGSKDMAAKGVSSLHVITPVDISIKGSKAFSVSVGSINARFERDGHDYEIISYCRFLSRLEAIAGLSHEGGNWKLLTMECVYLYDMILPALPTTGSNALVFDNLPATTRKSYRCLTWLLQQNGRSVNENMPGIDDEKSVQKVMKKNLLWLNS